MSYDQKSLYIFILTAKIVGLIDDNLSVYKLLTF